MKKNTLDDRDNVDFYLDPEKPVPNICTFDELEDIYKQEAFMALAWYKRAWYRFVIAVLQTIGTH